MGIEPQASFLEYDKDRIGIEGCAQFDKHPGPYNTSCVDKAGKYKLQELIDMEHFQNLQDRLNEIYSFPSAIIDNEGNILTATAWQDICTQFYRKNDRAQRECVKSDVYINEHMREANPAVSYKCPHGLVDNATPIIIDGVHYGNFFTGQFFLEAPDLNFYSEQARIYGFDEESFLAAVKKVPIWSEEQLKNYLFFIRGLLATISESALKNLREKESLKQIELGERRIGALIEMTNDGYWNLDIYGNIIDTNEAYAKMSGYSIEELLRLNFSELEAADSPEATHARYEQAISAGSILFESKHRRKNGTVFDVEMSGTYIPGENAQFVCFCRDISSRKQAEETLNHKTALLEAQLNASADGILVVDNEGKKILQNRRLVEIWKIPAEIANNPDDAAQVQHVMHQTKNPDQFVEKILYLYSHPDETTHDIVELTDGTILERYSAPVIGDAGLHYGRIWTFHDMTERRNNEESIAAEKERLAVTLRSIGDGVITSDTLGNVVIMNKVAEELTGWLQPEAYGKPLTLIFNSINETSRMPIENPVEKVLSTGLIIEQSNQTLLVSKDGTERIIADSAAPIKDRDSKTIGVVLVFRDMTEKQKMFDNMQRIDKLDSIGVLAGGIAHDFNNLLGGIFGYLDMAREHCASDALALRYLDKALSVFDRARDLTQQLLTFSKGGVPKRKTGQIGTLVRENASFALSGTNVSCAFNIASDLKLCDYDENQIGQVIDNIVLNAQQAMPLGGTITISVDNIFLNNHGSPSLPGGDYIRISIRDTGVGIPQDMLKRIFDPFFTTKQKGNGLGLATCYSIIQKHDGYIDVESVPGKGSAFHIFLPASQKASLQDLPQSVSVHKGKGSILVMDDEDFMREIVVDMLSAMGYSSIEARNGEEAIHLCADAVKNGSVVQAAFFDLTIPGGMGGKEAISLFREKFSDIPVFAASGFSEDPVMARPTDFNFTDSIRKPFKKNELAEMLNRHLK